MSMNDHIEEIVGKKILGVVAKSSEGRMSPASQLFLVFDDETYFEIYTSKEEMDWIKGLRPGDMDKVRNYAREFTTVQEYSEEVI